MSSKFEPSELQLQVRCFEEEFQHLTLCLQEVYRYTTLEHVVDSDDDELPEHEEDLEQALSRLTAAEHFMRVIRVRLSVLLDLKQNQ